jgi:hypothetical protein
MHKEGRSWALWLAAVIGGLIVLSGAYAEITRRESNAQAELRIALQELRSQIEEGSLLATHAKIDRHWDSFVREHARQLEKHMQASVDDVRTKAIEARHADIGEVAAQRGQDALASLRRVRSEPAAPATLDGAASEMERSSQALSRLLSTLPQQAR